LSTILVVGRTFHLFDWTRVTPTSAFAISSPYFWDLSNLGTTGEIGFTAIPHPSLPGVFLFGVLVVLAQRRAIVS
jgi:hypothetical protein